MHKSPATTEVYPTTVDKAGRVLLPIELRRPMKIDHESNLSWVKDETGLRLKTFEETIGEIQEYFKSLSPADDVWSESLISERKREADLESAKEAKGG